MDQRSTWYVRTLIIIMVIGGILRFRNLDGQSLWVDEMASLNWAMVSTWESSMTVDHGVVGIIGWINFHITKVIGHSDFAIRSISAVSGIILIGVIAEISRKMHNETSGIIVACLMASSYFAIYYSQEFRPYMFTTVILWIAIFIILKKEKNSPMERIGIVICLSFSWMAHYIAGLVVVILLFSLTVIRVVEWWRHDRENGFALRKQFADFLNSRAGGTLLISISVAALGFALVQLMLGFSADMSHSSSIPDTPDDPQLHLLSSFLGYNTSNVEAGGLVELLWLVILSSPIIMLLHRLTIKDNKRIENEGEWILWAISLGTLWLVILYSEHSRPLFLDRYFTFAMPAWFILIGLTISKAIGMTFDQINEENKKNLTIIASYAVAIGFLLNGINLAVVERDIYEERKSDFKGMSLWLDDNIVDNDAYIITQPSSYYWDLYLKRMDSEIHVDKGVWGTIPSSVLTTVQDQQPEIIVRLQGHNGWNWDDGGLRDTLDNGMENATYVLIEEKYFHKGKIEVYELLTFSKVEATE